MTRTPLTTYLAQLAREEQDALRSGLPDDLEAELEQLAHGQLSPERLEALEQRARADQRVAAALELYRPMGPEVQERFLAVARAGLKPAARAAVPATSQGPPADELARRRRRRRFLMVSSLASVAVAVGLFAISRTPVPGIPGYELAITGGDATVRGEPLVAEGKRLRLFPDGELDLVLRPVAAPATSVEARAFVALPDGSRRTLAVVPELSPTGAVRISGSVGRVFAGLEGDFTLLVVLHHPRARLPAWPPVDNAAGPGWRQVSIPIQLVPTPPAGR